MEKTFERIGISLGLLGILAAGVYREKIAENGLRLYNQIIRNVFKASYYLN